MSQPPQSGDAESQWQQPPFQPSDGQPSPAQPSWSNPGEGQLSVPDPVAGRFPVPVDRSPPSALESAINVLNGVLWPALIALAIFGIGSWLANIMIAIVASAVLRGIATELRRRRRCLPPTETDSLR